MVMVGLIHSCAQKFHDLLLCCLHFGRKAKRGIPSWTSVEKVKFPMSHTVVDVLLSQEQVNNV